MDDSCFSYARAFVNNTITVEQLGRSVRLGNLGEQIMLKSERTFKKFDLLDLSVRRKLYMAPWPRSEMRRQERSTGSYLPKARLRGFVSSISFERG